MSADSLTLDTALVRREGLVSADVGQEVVMLQPERNAYYDVNAVGAEIWRRLERPTSGRAICDDLVGIYEVDPAVCQTDVLAFLTDALREGLIRVVA